MNSISLGNVEYLEFILSFDEYYYNHPSRKSEVERALKDDACYIMTMDHRIIGYGIFRGYSFLEEAFVHLIVIDPKSRGKGYGGKFLEYFESISPTDRLHISTNTSNLVMQTLLKERNYEKGGVINSIDDRDPEIFYYKNLN